MPKVNGFVDVNPTPIPIGQTAEWAAWDALAPGTKSATPEPPVRWQMQPVLRGTLNALGAADVFGAYEGTINRALTWYKDGAIQTGGVDWAREADNINPSGVEMTGTNVGPYTPEAFEAIMALAAAPSSFGLKTQSAPLDVFVDIERPGFNTDFSWMPAEMSRARMGRIRDILNTMQGFNINDGRVGWYGFPFGLPHIKTVDWDIPEHFASSGMVEVGEAVSFLHCSFYDWDACVLNPDRWKRDVEATDTICRRYFNWLPKIAAVIPRYQVYWDPKLAKFNNVPLSLARWESNLTFLTDRGWDLHWWDGQGSIDVAAHAKSFGKFIYPRVALPS